MAACVPTYMLASSLINGGMNWWQAVLTIFFGNCIVLVPMALNAHAGTRYGIPFPVYCRAAFGLRGANVPGVQVRAAFVACGWFGIQTWIGGMATYLAGGVVSEWATAPPIAGLRHHLAASELLLRFLPREHSGGLEGGIDTIRVLLQHQGDAAHRPGVGPACLGLRAGGRVRTDFVPAFGVRGGPAERGAILGLLLPGLDGQRQLLGDPKRSISPTSARRCSRCRDQIVGQRRGLPPTMRAVFVHRCRGDLGDRGRLRGVTAIWDPVHISWTKFELVSRGPDRGDVLPLPGDAGDQHCRQRRFACQRLCPLEAEVDFVPRGRPDHRRHRASHSTVASRGQRRRLHRYLVDWLFAGLLLACGGVLIADY